MELTAYIKNSYSLKNKEREGICMLGGIYSDQKCNICGSRLKEDLKRKALTCPKHPNQKASRFRVYFKGITKRFASYSEATRYLTGLRFKTDEGSFDKRDYKMSCPLGFENLVNQWLKIKEKEVKRSSWIKINDHMNKAVKEWGNRNIKEIKMKDIQLLLNSLDRCSFLKKG